MERYHSLDIVRGFAALSVLLTHWGGWTVSFADDTTTKIIVFYQKAFGFLLWGGGGIHPGVIIFIVLSGFCIHLPQALDPAKLANPGFWRMFALRRSGRILPVFWLALLLGVSSIWLMGAAYTGEEEQAINGNLLFSVFGVAEISRLFGVTNLYPGNGPLSTVAVEILLYASYPLFLFIYKRNGFGALLGFGLLVYFCVAFARLLGVEPNRLHGTYFEFVIYWIVGATSAGVYSKMAKNRYISYGNFLVFVSGGYLFYLVMTSFVSIKGFHVVTTLLLAFLTGGMLIVLLSMESRLNRRNAKIAAGFAVLGSRSYSLYVVHTPVILSALWFFGMHTNLPVFSYPLLTMSAVLVSTEIMFRLVERPSHQYAKSWRLQ